MASAGSQQMDLEGPFLHGSCISDEFCFKVCCILKLVQISTILGDILELRGLVPTHGNPFLFSQQLDGTL